MAKVVSCRDVGVDCDFTARGRTEEELLRILSAHARTEHGMKEISEELKTKIRRSIHEEAA